ncbi:MAG TPA: hypothetical protein VLE69_01590 [Candidatus Saccharimonadales bacterium]|nr:hypothetical protein [Candidatus Saccharimonadales bacterium]
MAEAVMTYGDDGFYDFEKAEALIRSVHIEIAAPLAGKVATHADWPQEIASAPTPRSLARPVSLRAALYSGVNVQNN